MNIVQYLYRTIEEFQTKLDSIDIQKESLVQIYTCKLEPEEAVDLAAQIQAVLPKGHIIGTSVNGIIYQREQYENDTLIVVEQYEKSQVGTRLLELEGRTYAELSNEIRETWTNETKLMKLFIGAYYDYAHQLVEELNCQGSAVKIAGGMSGELYKSKTIPFVFDANRAIAEGLVLANIGGRQLSIYSRINTSHEMISEPYTITKAYNRVIAEIEHEPAKEWLAQYLGFSANQQYDDWEDIAKNDPFVHFQLALENHRSSIRYVRYNAETDEITQYFSRLNAGERFRICYLSPAKCVEEGRAASKEISEFPIEHLFCYSCLFRKLYMKNCAQWELEPYQETPVSGVFLLGEFGHSEGGNTLLNGSCVLSGIAENMNFIQVNKDALQVLHRIEEDNQGLLNFVTARQGEVKSDENKRLLKELLATEKIHQIDLYVDPYLKLPNMHKYELDRKKLSFTQLCLMKIMNADMLMSYMGQVEYYQQLSELLDKLLMKSDSGAFGSNLHAYTIHADTFVLAANAEMEKADFIFCVEHLEKYCNEISSSFEETPFLIRLVVVSDHEYLLEHAYSQLQLYGDSQTKLIVESESEEYRVNTMEELEVIKIIQNALVDNKVVPYYQGIYNNKTRKIDKYEALMRILDRDGNILAPRYFMDVAKKYRLYLDLNQKMFELVLEDFSSLDCSVNINMSAHDITSEKFRVIMRERLQVFPNPENITFEILEDEPFKDMQALTEFIAEVRGYGAKIAIDDFGAGYSNLLEIMKIRPDYLKIDGQIIRDIHKNFENEVIVDVTTTLGRKLSIDLVAEFVENEEVQQMVEKYGILRSQGYLFSKPQPFQEIYELEKNRKE